jgi:hypothetical protein
LKPTLEREAFFKAEKSAMRVLEAKPLLGKAALQGRLTAFDEESP